MRVKIGSVVIGDGNPIAIQSMTNTDTKDVERTIFQIKKLEDVKVDIVRISTPDVESARAIKEIKRQVRVPIVADVHFDYRIAIEAIKSGADKVRINPGNIGADWKVKELAKVAKEYGVPVRVGSNTGSLPKDIEGKMERWEALAEAALREVKILEEAGFYDIVVAAKSSDAIETIKAYEYIKSKVDYPLHIGVTEAGTYESALIKSSFALGYLLYRGIGDTIRISIAGEPVKEVIAARKLLSFLGLRKEPQVIACPTCARAVFDVEKIAEKIESILFKIDKPIVFSVLGCFVNGVGEGKHADAGIAGVTGDKMVAFKGGKIYKEFKKEDLEKIIQELISNE
ncbi:MAG: flavodoxin-dependent (E)-4-hydroxy-3-methylbut-2-enyl-diphosphate synthase [Thermotogaceae bacterium]|nr:flavodoxin-dependent (E)-4-hydroxy-3-methylbut-2-enyl-diphosphate synthase [Thermotogaceae bacterium]